MMKELRSEIEIAAPAGRVWQVLTDFAAFPQWNPFIRKARGALREGERIEIMMQPSGAGGMTFHPTVLTVEAERELRWIGHLFVPGLFDGEHIFSIEPRGTGRVLFIQREIFTGLLVPLLARMLDTSTRHGFDEMNKALKVRAEQAPV
jgi:hypothetical protein